MQQFHFRLESLLRLKTWQEENAKKKLGEEINQLTQQKQELSRLQEENMALLASRRFAGSISASEHMRYIHYGHLLLSRASMQMLNIREQEKRVAEATKFLNAAIMERKKMEKLKERQHSEHNKIQRRKEISILDEVSSNFLKRQVAAQGSEV